mmetsp:Transcript_8803/g.24757  ORF Transcript_8803/g.24757 Transcript_8803/m.24757 type:complete len:269 (-) Transcript_8803:90-896(-)|eukprot:CAMPEP_0119147312 /NCGR_PEP_ID=MMETSP1310-20130426/40163_1 /TAXON_ID=464262 /ORGANISM="Genus nov. species nov., Strain RCC2339" /LENGTH=268 /DNA_ID=CAMNT_0007139269 /DNA_START=145 /DNA_END=951 /DNA_ORIENTATION=-
MDAIGDVEAMRQKLVEQESRLQQQAASIHELQQENARLRARQEGGRLKEARVFEGTPDVLLKSVVDFIANEGPHPPGRLVVVMDPDSQLGPKLLSARLHRPDLLDANVSTANWESKKEEVKAIAGEVTKLARDKGALQERNFVLPEAPPGEKCELWKGAAGIWNTLEPLRLTVSLLQDVPDAVSVETLISVSASTMQEACRAMHQTWSYSILQNMASPEIRESFISDVVKQNTTLEKKKEVIREENRRIRKFEEERADRYAEDMYANG